MSMPRRVNLLNVKGYLNMERGSTAAVAPADEGRMIYDEISQRFEISHNTGLYYPIVTTSGALGVPFAYLSYTASATIAIPTNHTLIEADATTSAVDLTLPDATATALYVLHCKRMNAGANWVWLLPVLAQTIDGAPNVIIRRQWVSVAIISNGTNWSII